MRNHARLNVLLISTAFALTAAAQQPADVTGKLDALLAPLQTLPPSIDDGFRALDGLAALQLDPAKLASPARTRYCQIEVIGALAVGDAARAIARLADLKTVMKDDTVLQMLSYQVPTAAGNAKLALAAVDSAAAGKMARVDQAALARTRRWLERVGTPVPPELLAKLGAGAGPRKALVIDLWTEKKEPPEADAKALAALYASFETEIAFEMTGVNIDGPAAAAKAKAAAQKRGYKWRQLEDATPIAAALKAFEPIAPPQHVLIDARGYVRALGVASDPGFVYAVRAAVAEARGDFPYIAPINTKGQPAVTTEGPAAGTGSTAKAEKKAEPGKGAGELPSNPDAEAKLNRARLYLKTGKKTEARKLFEEIVRDYPGTREALIAQEFLD